MTGTYKIMWGMDKVDREIFFSLSYNIRTSGHLLKLSVGVKILLFSMCSLWNSLAQDDVRPRCI